MSSTQVALNERQNKAVSAPLGNLLVLAGAGSGKTRVLVNRIAWLIEEKQCSPYNILAVTFTNKAAREMRGRIEKLVDRPIQGMWVGTFHSLAHRLLRAHWRDAHLPEAFQIIDSEDQYRLIRRILKTLNLDEDQWKPKQVQWFISSRKDEGLRSKHIEPLGDVYLQTMVKIYQTYEQACTRGGLVDFAELLLRAHELWLNHAVLLQHYQQRFVHTLVDEFQDTNTIQYAWLRLLVGQGNTIMAVGDDDQSIYGWRGAKIENIQRFQQDFPQATLICLEQNYRSTQVILEAANALISHNENRLGEKQLWTKGEKGEPISLYAAFNEVDEARYIMSQIVQRAQQGTQYCEIAVLYRSNAQSRVLEEALISKGVPYQIYGGMRFFDRAEIKDVLAYLRLLNSRDDDAAIERIINVPTRGLGQRSVESLRQFARQQNLSLWRAAKIILEENRLSARAHKSMQAFLELIDQLEQSTKTLTLAEQTKYVIQHSGLWEHYTQEKGEKAQSRKENLEELVMAAKGFRLDSLVEELSELAAFVSHAALEGGEYTADFKQDCVQLMTLHSAKGLEFPVVFIAGIEEGLFPHQLSLNEEGRLQEERRLCYVGMTRAMRKLYLTYAEIRRHYGKETYHRPSRFIREMPADLLAEVRASFKASTVKGFAQKSQVKRASLRVPESQYKIGQMVRHKKFGEGVIVNYEGSGDHARLEVRFKKHGSKWLVLAYAKLQT